VVEAVPPGRHELSIAGGDSSSFLHVQSSREVAVVDRDVILDVALGERHAVAVEVVDNGGRPVSGVAVHGTLSAGEWEHSLAW
jgi:hypothetical protein